MKPHSEDLAAPDPASPGARATRVIGILGGIASGKSAVARLLAGPEGRVVSADALAQEVLDSPELVRLVSADFGADCLRADGLPDRGALARRVFGDPEARRRLEGWTHPPVRARITAAVEDARSDQLPVVVLDVPLLLENDGQHGFTGLCDSLVFVDACESVRDRRAVLSRGWAAGEVARREAAQMPLPEKRRRAHYSIRNEGTLGELERTVRAVLTQMGQTHHTPRAAEHDPDQLAQSSS